MSMLKTIVSVGGDDPALEEFDTIEFEGKLWIVPTWTDSQDGKWTTPDRIICISNMPREKMLDGRTLLSGSVPRSLLYGEVPPGTDPRFVVVDRPGIVLPHPNASN